MKTTKCNNLIIYLRCILVFVGVLRYLKIFIKLGKTIKILDQIKNSKEGFNVLENFDALKKLIAFILLIYESVGIENENNKIGGVLRRKKWKK